MALAAKGMAVQRMEACVIEKRLFLSELLAWSSHLTYNTSTSTTTKPYANRSRSRYRKAPHFLHQAALIEQLIQVKQKLDTRWTLMETKIYNQHKRTAQDTDTSKETSSSQPPAKRRRTSAANSLKEAWYSGYAQEPLVWSLTDASTKQKRSTIKLAVAFMKLFLPRGFELDETSPRYRDEVLALGQSVEVELLSFLRERDVTARSAQNVLKSVRKLYHDGHQAAGRVIDPAPKHTTHLLGLITVAELRAALAFARPPVIVVCRLSNAFHCSHCILHPNQHSSAEACSQACQQRH